MRAASHSAIARLRATMPVSDSWELISGASSAFVLKLLGMGVGYAYAVAVARMFGTEAWGVFSLSLVVLTVGSIVGRLGVDTAALRLAAQARAAGRLEIQRLTTTALLIVAPTSCVIGLGAFVGAEALAVGIFRKPELGGAFRLAAASIPPVAVGLLSSQVLRGLRCVREYVFFDLVARFLAALMLLLPFSILLQRHNPPVVSFVVGAYCVALANLWVLRRRVAALPNRDEGVEVKRVSTAGMLRIGLPLLLASSAVYLKGWIDTVMLGIYATSADVGVYNLALKLAALAALPLMAVNTIAAPQMAEAFGRGDLARLSRIVAQAGRLVMFGSIPITVALLMAPKFWLGIFGPEVAIAAPALIVLTCAYLVSALAGPVGYLLQMTGRQVAFQNITLFSLGLCVLLNAVLIPKYGIVGAAATTAAGLIAWNGIGAVYVYRTLGIVSIVGARASTSQAHW